MAIDRAALERLYSGEPGRVWDRIERERPATYWEENAIGGRRLARRTIVHWLEPLTRHTVLDAGCGAGALGVHLAGLGAKVVGIDLLPRFRPVPRVAGLRFAVGDLRQRGSAPGAFTAAILQEVLEDYPPEDRVEVVRSLAEWGARSLILVARIQSSWGEWADRLSSRDRQPPVDLVALFRGIHLETPYFLTRRETLRRRNHAAEIAEFTLSHDGRGV
jgi:SAM-dependent methyltransferase